MNVSYVLKASENMMNKNINNQDGEKNLTKKKTIYV